jgi:hypothetical protein
MPDARIYRVELGYPHALDRPGGGSTIRTGMFEELAVAVAATAGVLNTTVGTWVRIAAHEGDSEGFMVSDETRQPLTQAERDEIARVFAEHDCRVYPTVLGSAVPDYFATNMEPSA